MTEYWVSQAKHWCDICKCWMNDTPASRANHEKGSGHKINVQKKLRETRLKAEREKKEEERNLQELKRIEKAADKAYQKDLATQEEEAPPLPPPAQPPPQFGSWSREQSSGYWYNKQLRWYYDEKTGFYYGGEPPAWSQSPAIPDGARFDKLGPADGSQAKNVTVIRGKLPQDIANLGGHRAPTEGTLTRGIIVATDTEVKPRAEAGSTKRARGAEDKELSEREKAERARRDAARARVQARTAQSFGLE